MFVAALAATLLAQAEPTLAAPDLSVVNLEANRASLFAEHFAQQLTGLGFVVVTSKQIASVLGQERQRLLMGCGEQSSSCVAELASALGSEAIVVGSVAKLESTYQVNLSIVSAKDGKPLTVMSSRESSEEGVFDAITREAPRMAQETFAKLRPGKTLTLARSGVRRYSWIPGAAAVVLAGVGTGLLVASWDKDDRLAGAGSYAGQRYTLAEAGDLRSQGSLLQTSGGALIIVGAAALAAGGAMFLFGADQPAGVAVAPTPTGAVFALSGSFP